MRTSTIFDEWICAMLQESVDTHEMACTCQVEGCSCLRHHAHCCHSCFTVQQLYAAH